MILQSSRFYNFKIELVSKKSILKFILKLDHRHLNITFKSCGTGFGTISMKNNNFYKLFKEITLQKLLLDRVSLNKFQFNRHV